MQENGRPKLSAAHFFWGGLCLLDTLLAGIGDVPDGAGAIVGDEEAAVVGHGDADGPAPDLAVFGDEAGRGSLRSSPSAWPLCMGMQMTS